MPFNPQKIQAEIAESGIQKTNKFLIQFGIPRGMFNNPLTPNLTGVNRRLELYGESALVPGVALLTQDIRRYGYGPTEKKPVTAMFTDWPVTLRIDGVNEIPDFFRQWIRLQVNFEVGGPESTGTMAGITGAMPNQRLYEVAYKEDYAVDAQIVTFTDDGNVSNQIRLRGCFPIHMGEVLMDWSRVNDYARLPVTFSYTDWSSTATPAINNANLRTEGK